MSERTAVYRLYDADDALLYVGISNRFGYRWEQHAKVQPWWPKVQRQTVDWYPGRTEALAAETAAIKSEMPLHNVAHTPRAEKVHASVDGPRELRSDEARRLFRDLLDEVERDPDAAIKILRYDRPLGVLVSADWYSRITTAEAVGGPDKAVEILQRVKEG